MGQRFSKCLNSPVAGNDLAPLPIKPHAVAQGFPLQEPGIPCRCECSSELRAEIQLLRELVQNLQAECTRSSVRAAGIAPIPRSPRPSAELPERKYKGVQFVPLLIMTGPHSDSKDSRYVGLPYVREDFSARVDFVREALLQAQELADKVGPQPMSQPTS